MKSPKFKVGDKVAYTICRKFPDCDSTHYDGIILKVYNALSGYKYMVKGMHLAVVSGCKILNEYDLMKR